MLKTRLFSRRGFTLIELLTVIAIIGILAVVLLPAISAAKVAALKGATQTMFQQWCTGLSAYKTEYKYYPDLGGSTANEDTYYTLDQGDTPLNLIRALQGRNYDGTQLSDSERKQYNRKAKEFCSFGNEAFENEDPKTKKLVDRFGNARIRIVLDTNNDGMVILKELPSNTNDLGLQPGNKINAKIVIYTLEKDGSGYKDIFVKQ